MQNNNENNDKKKDSFQLLVDTIKQVEFVKYKLKLFVRHMPVFFWQRKNLLEVLGPFGYVGFLKLLEMYKIEEVAAQRDIRRYLAETFMKKLGLRNSEYAPFIKIAENEEGKEEKKRVIEKLSPISSTLRLFLDDNVNVGAKLKLSDFDGLEKYEIAKGLCNLIVKEGIFESVKELKKYCNEDLNRVLVGVNILIMVMQKSKELKSKNIPDALKNILCKFLNDNDAQKIKLSDFNNLDKLSNYQICNGLYNLINSGLVLEFDRLEEYFDDGLVRMFFIAMFEVVADPKEYPNFVNLKCEGPQGECKTFFGILRESIEFIIDKKSGAKIGPSDFPGIYEPSRKIANIIYTLIYKGVVKNYGELKKYFVDDWLVFGNVFLYLIYDDLEFRFKHNRASEIAEAFKISEKVIGYVFDYYIILFTINEKLHYPVFTDDEKFIANSVLKCVFRNVSRNACFGLQPHYIVRYIAVFTARKPNLYLSENGRTIYKRLFDGVTPYTLTSTIEDPSKSWNDDTEDLKKLFVLLCTMGVLGFSIKSDLKSFSNDLKIDEKKIKNAFTKVLSKDKESDDFRNLYSLLTDCSSNSAFLTVVTSDKKLLRPVLLAIIETMDLENMEKMLLACLGHQNSMCLQEGINECLNKMNALDHHGKIKLILALIKTQQLADGLACHPQYKETICEALYGKNRIKIDTGLKLVFYDAFKICIKNNDINGYELNQIVNFRKIIGLSEKQISIVLAREECYKNAVDKLLYPPNIKEDEKELPSEFEKNDEISDDPKELIDYAAEEKELICCAMKEMNLHRVVDTLIEHLGCLNPTGFYRMLKECASIDFIDKLNNDRKIISIIAFIKANQVLSADRYSNKYGHHFKHGIYRFMYSDDRTKLRSDLKKVFDKAFEVYINSDKVSRYELKKIIECQDVIGLNCTQLRAILDNVLEVEAKEEKGETIFLDEKENEKDRYIIKKVKSKYKVRPKITDEYENDKNGPENKFVGKKHNINKER